MIQKTWKLYLIKTRSKSKKKKGKKKSHIKVKVLFGRTTDIKEEQAQIIGQFRDRAALLRTRRYFGDKSLARLWGGYSFYDDETVPADGRDLPHKLN